MGTALFLWWTRACDKPQTSSVRPRVETGTLCFLTDVLQGARPVRRDMCIHVNSTLNVRPEPGVQGRACPVFVSCEGAIGGELRPPGHPGGSACPRRTQTYHRAPISWGVGTEHLPRR